MFGTHEDPTEVWRERAAAIRQRRMRSESDGHLAAPRRSRGSPCASRCATGSLQAARSRPATNRYHPASSDFVSHTRPQVRRARAAGTRSFVQRRVERIRAVDGGFELDGEGPFAHVLVATGHPGLARPSDSERRARVRAARVRVACRDRRRRHGGGDGVAERARRRCRGGLDPPPRAAAPAAQRAAAATSRSEVSRRSIALNDNDRATKLRELASPSYPPGPDWDEPLDQRAPERRLTVLDVARGGSDVARRLQVICATGFRKGCRARSAAFGPGRCARARDPRAAGSCSTPTRPFPRSPTTRARSRSPASPPVGVPRSRHDRGREVRRPRLPPPRMSYTLRGRIESRARRDAAGAAARARPAPLVGDRARRADARDRSRARRRRLRPRAARTSRRGSRCRSARSSWRSSTRRCAISGSPRRCGSRSLLYAVGWLSAQVLGHGALPAPAARVRRGGR